MMDAMEVAAALRRAAENAGCGLHEVVSGGEECPEGSCNGCREASAAWANEAANAIERLSLPEGVEWPMFEDRDPVKFGDKFVERGGIVNAVDSVEIGAYWFEVHGFDGASSRYDKGERVKRPPVIAADGEPLEVGQTVWHVGNGMEFSVSRLPKPGEYQAVEVRYRNGSSTSFDPCQLTHQRPVLDADGVPIKVGDTVYFTDGREQECNTVVHAKYDYKDEPYIQLGRLNEAGYPTYTNCSCIDPSKLTHNKPEPPDSWVRLWIDMFPRDESEVVGLDRDEFVRRCKELAERGE